MPTAKVIHEMDGRTRVRIPSKKRDTAYFQRLKDTLRQMPGVHEVETNPVTGSVVLHHTAGLDSVRKFASENGLFDLAEASETAVVLAHRIHQQMEGIDDQVLDFTRGTLDLRSLIVVLVSAGAVIQAFRKQLMPPALNLMWYALALVWPKHPHSMPGVKEISTAPPGH